MKEHVCARCGKPFVSQRSTAMYCSNRCRTDEMNERKIARQRAERAAQVKEMKDKICVQCGKPFWSQRDTAKYCSPACVKKHYRQSKKKPAVLTKKTCVGCGKEFETVKEQQIYCCYPCRKKAEDHRSYQRRRQPGYVPVRTKGVNDWAVADRPPTEDTAFLVQKWYKEGDSLEKIARVLFRRLDEVEVLLAVPLTKGQQEAMEKFLLPRRGDK